MTRAKIPKTKIFGGKRYSIIGTTDFVKSSKSGANRLAEAYRDQGYNARVVRIDGKNYIYLRERK